MGILISTNDAAARLGMVVDDPAAFEAVVFAADGAIKAILQRDPTLQEWTELYNGTGCEILGLNRIPVVAVSQIAVRPKPFISSFPPSPIDLTQVTNDNNAVYWSASVFPHGKKNIAITYTAGYAADAPEMAVIVHAVMLTIKAMWSGKDADQNASSQSFGGVMSQSFWQGGPGMVPPQAMALIQPYINHFQVA